MKASVLAALSLGLSACTTTYYVPAGDGRIGGIASVAQGFSGRALARMTADMDPAMLRRVRRHDPLVRQTDYWGRPVGWETLDLHRPPSLGFGLLQDAEAVRVNALIPDAPDAPAPARPFVLKAGAAEQARALLCLTQAVYYEAALEPAEGQAAVAQVVLNRVRHPAYPKTICGVVYQGAMRFTGCQFSFTCDGSVLSAPVPGYWERAQRVAERALAGFVMRDVGTATFYHADYVLPVWGPLLVKMRQIGRHIFYRFPGPMGTPNALRGRYLGGETKVSLEVRPQPADPETLDEAEELLGMGGVKMVAVADATAPGGQRLRAQGVIAGRRTPTKDEIARINASLAELPQAQPAAPKPAEPTTPAFSETLPIRQRE